MSTDIYLDLVENPIKRWIINFCNVDECDFDFIGEEYCLLFPEKIDGVKKCVMLYVDNIYPPFEDTKITIKDNKYLNFLTKAISTHIKKFYAIVAKTLIDNNVTNSDLLKNTTLGYYTPNETFAPYPIDGQFIKDNKKIYEDILSLPPCWLASRTISVAAFSRLSAFSIIADLI